jgi:AcrR family transcriptional regulator
MKAGGSAQEEQGKIGASGAGAPHALLNASRPRSVATTQRMLTVAEALLRKHGNKFTLSEVAKAGRMSMASIYARYPSKEDLILAIQDRVIGSMEAEIREGLDQIHREAGDARWTIVRLVDVYSEAQRRKAELIRNIYIASQDDPRLHARGVKSFEELILSAQRTIMRHESSAQPQANLDNVHMALIIFLHALSSYVGFSHTVDPIDLQQWERFKQLNADLILRSLRATA